jgi:sodium transport system permease protein
MRTVLVVARKELVDVFRDTKTVMVGLLMMPLLFPALIFGTATLAERRERTQEESTLRVPIIGAEHAPNLVRYLRTLNIEALPAPSDPDADVRAQVHDVVLRIAPDFGERWRESRSAQVELIFDSSRQDAETALQRVRAAIQSYNGTVGGLRIMDRGISPEVLAAVRIAPRDVATPESKQGMILSFFLPYLLIFTGFLGGAFLTIDVTAGERERQSLEPLLATPAQRTAIMSGKILAGITMGMIGLLLLLAVFKLSFDLAPGRLQFVALTWPVQLQLLAVLLPMVLVGTTLLTLISASVKSVKEAQSYMSVLILLPMVPPMILMANPVKTQLWHLAVPFLAQNQVILRLIRGEAVTAPEWAVYLGASFALGAVLWGIAARLYHNERLAVSA